MTKLAEMAQCMRQNNIRGDELQDIHDHTVKYVVVSCPKSIKAVQDDNLGVIVGLLRYEGDVA